MNCVSSPENPYMSRCHQPLKICLLQLFQLKAAEAPDAPRAPTPSLCLSKWVTTLNLLWLTGCYHDNHEAAVNIIPRNGYEGRFYRIVKKCQPMWEGHWRMVNMVNNHGMPPRTWCMNHHDALQRTLLKVASKTRLRGKPHKPHNHWCICMVFPPEDHWATSHHQLPAQCQQSQ